MPRIPRRTSAGSADNRTFFGRIAASVAVVVLVLVQLVSAPLLVASVSLLQQRRGVAAAGWVAGLPLTTGPVMVLLACGQGPGFAAASTAPALWGVAVQCCVYGAYAHVSRRTGPGWRGLCVTFAAVGLVFTVLVVFLDRLLQVLNPPALAALLVGVVAPVTTLKLWPRLDEGLLSPASRPHLGVRCAAAAALTFTTTMSAPVLGPRLAGLLSTLPVVGLTLTLGVHLDRDGRAGRHLLRQLTLATPSIVAFLAVLMAGLTRLPPVPVFVAAFAAAGVAAALSLRARN